MFPVRYVLLIVVLLFTVDTFAQYGCTDYQATNYDPLAVINDGTCTYAHTALPLTFKCYVDSSHLWETSGLINNNNAIWSHVDNTDNSIYRIDTTSPAIFQRITILNSFNQDWEDISSDNNYVYVGDIGNNGGGRTNLRYYKIAKSDIHPNTSYVNAGKIRFSYSDQVVFNIANGNYYDCEAFFVLNDSIHMFTKGWVNRWTKHYVLPADTGYHVAQLVDSFNADGVITSAAIQGDSMVVLLGLNYTGNNESFIWVFNKFNESHFFKGNKRRFIVGNLNTTGQMEAVCFSGPKKCFISNEGLPTIPAQIREFDLNPYFPDVPNAVASVSSNTSHLNLNACGDHGTFSITISNPTLSGGRDLSYSLGLLPGFASCLPFNDTLHAGDSATITLNFNSGNLPGGTYTEDIVIITNDPFNTLLQLPVTLNVDSNPCLDFGFVSDTCTGTLNFTSSSINSPTSYHWDFGDGNSSNAANPVHSFTADGNHTVTLTGCNSAGCDTIVKNVTSLTNGLVSATCYPQTQSYCCGSGIVHFRIIGPSADVFNNPSSDASAGYEDFSCTASGMMVTGFPYTVACTTGDSLLEALKVWIDLNNDGFLDPLTEEVFSDTTNLSNVHIGSLLIPALPGNVYGIPLRMRVGSDYQSVPSPCHDPLYGQDEDYSIILNFSNKITDRETDASVSVYPSPFKDVANLNYTLDKSSFVTVNIYNAIGEKVETLINPAKQSSGNYSHRININTPGIYFVKLTIDDRLIVERIVKY
jgi:PKD repeat protein